ncbi:hypothetical protein [Gilliamella sp. A7]|uniref:hypothetical protein n=1 Tax=Gilliamella sp. A7 TaxID=1970465 RepID=UPI000A32E180|nr:hypothetical protein [Gilliamella sp. A7]OTQ57661.1 hypothetical protein B6D18_09390 [Gilliamella sp. A7]
MLLVYLQDDVVIDGNIKLSHFIFTDIKVSDDVVSIEFVPDIIEKNELASDINKRNKGIAQYFGFYFEEEDNKELIHTYFDSAIETHIDRNFYDIFIRLRPFMIEHYKGNDVNLVDLVEDGFNIKITHIKK